MPQEYDKLIDWKQLYAKYIRNMTVNGDELKGQCPLHPDSDPSFTANIKTGLFKCYGCDASGNPQVFLQQYHNIGPGEAVKMLNEEAGIKEKQERRKYTIEDYGAAKKLPVDFLKELKLSNNKTGITIPYMDESGAVMSTRQRYGDTGKGPRFLWTRGSKVSLYGLWKMPQIREAGEVTLVEGESDCHTLWFHGFQALGVPGATVFQPKWVSFLKGLTVYVFQESDAGGETFIRKISEALCRAPQDQRPESVYLVKLIDHKDPSELHCSSSENFKSHWEQAIKNAPALDYKEAAGTAENVIPDAPVQLKQPPGWQFNQHGIFMNDEKTGIPTCVSRIPIIICQRLRSLETGQEKIEIAFRRDEAWHRLAVLRSTLFQAKSITTLSDYGITVTSENARFLVKFLAALEAENIDILERAECVSQLGWHGKQFVPSYNTNLVIDVEPSTQKWLDGYHEEGTMDDWINSVSGCRHNDVFRFMLAASFAAPLLRLLNHRIFILHNWGKTRIGKTAALKAALSVWGEPESLLANFYATKVGLERLAGFFRDLPLGIDEKQVVSGNGKGDFIDSLMYMISLGSGKVRGAKQGGLQSTSYWRTIAITTGEEPLTNYSSHSGMFSRVLEIYGAPFSNEAEAQRLHLLKSYGQAGPLFIKKVIETGVPELTERFDWFLSFLEDHFRSGSGQRRLLQTHISAIAIVAAADSFVSEWVFGEEPEQAKGRALDMCLEVAALMVDTNEADSTERAHESILDWIISNKDQFKDEARAPRYGDYRSELNCYLIFPTILKDYLERQGFSYKGVIQGMYEKGHLETNCERGFGYMSKVDGHSARFIAVRMEENGGKYGSEKGN